MTTKIISETELDIIFNNLSKLAELANTNAYDYYIHMLKKQRLSEQPDSSKELLYERHHIIPRFEKINSTETPENLVKVTVKEHVIAHWLRYKVFNKPQDLCAYLFRVGDTINSIMKRNELVSQAREKDRIEKRYFFNSDFQTEMGKRGGPGSAGSDAQFLARQKVGLEYGRKTGIKNQNETLKKFVANWSIWAFSENAFSTSRVKDRGKELHVLISPKKSFVEVFQALKTFVPFSLEGKNPAPMHKLVYNERKNMFGWRIERTLTCSEAVEGIQDFYQNTSEILYFEEHLLVNEDLE